MTLRDLKAALQILEKYVSPDEDVFHAEHETRTNLESHISGKDMEILDGLGWGQ
jgi:hypothetical protein